MIYYTGIFLWKFGKSAKFGAFFFIYKMFDDEMIYQVMYSVSIWFFFFVENRPNQWKKKQNWQTRWKRERENRMSNKAEKRRRRKSIFSSLRYKRPKTNVKQNHSVCLRCWSHINVYACVYVAGWFVCVSVSSGWQRCEWEYRLCLCLCRLTLFNAIRIFHCATALITCFYCSSLMFHSISIHTFLLLLLHLYVLEWSTTNGWATAKWSRNRE